jgi:hypothetical protein
MDKNIIIIENFYEDPLKIRDYALNELKNNYYLPYGVDNWRSTQFKEHDRCPFKSSTDLISKLESATEEQVDIEDWNRSRPPHGEDNEQNFIEPRQSPKWNCTFHFKPINNEKPGAHVHNHVTDCWNGLDYNDWVGLIYLNPQSPIDSGLFLWENINKSNNLDWMTDKENWKLIDSFGSVFNRLILVKSQHPHSGADGFSDSLEEGRLYQTFFFRTVNKKNTSSVIINL